MRLRQLFEQLNRTGEGKSCVVGWGRGMGHKGHMYLADAVITEANDQGADPYFVVSRTVGKDDPITPDEKLAIYQKVFPKHGHIFHTATEEMPDLTRVLRRLNEHGYTKCTVVVGADQVNALSYVKKYNGVRDKEGNIPFDFTDGLDVISRQMTKAKTANIEGPRATPMRAILQDPNATEEEKFAAWRDAMSPELSDDEVRDLMHKAQQRMSDPAFGKAPKKPKKEKVADESLMGFLSSPIFKAGDKAFHNMVGHVTIEKVLPNKVVVKDKTGKSFSMAPHTLKKTNSSTEEMRKYFEKEKAKEQPNVANDLRDKKVQQVFTRSDENSVKYANKVVREMRAQEFIRKRLAEGDVPYAGKGAEKLHHVHIQALKNAMSIPNISMNKANGSPYMQYRFGLAMANPDMPRAGAMSGDPLITAYTDAELKKVQDAAKTLGAGTITHLSDGVSNEAEGGNTTSPVATPKKNKYGI